MLLNQEALKELLKRVIPNDTIEPCDKTRKLIEYCDGLTKGLLTGKITGDAREHAQDEIESSMVAIEFLGDVPCNCRQCVATRFETKGEMRGVE
jgi:hypothetical protein